MPEVLLTGYVEPCEKVVRDAARGVVICKEGRSGGRSDGLRLSQGDREFRQRWLIPFPGHLEHRSGRQPAWRRESAVTGCFGRAALRGLRQWNTDLHNGTQLRCLCMLKELWANARRAQTAIRGGPKRSRAMYQSTKELGRVSGS